MRGRAVNEDIDGVRGVGVTIGSLSIGYIDMAKYYRSINVYNKHRILSDYLNAKLRCKYLY